MIMRWLTAVVAGLILTAPAFGHAKLRGSLPAADAQLQAAPKSLTLTFNETVRLAVLTLTIDGKDIPVTSRPQRAGGGAGHRDFAGARGRQLPGAMERALGR